MDDPNRYHLVLIIDDKSARQGWWGREETARSKFRIWVGECSGKPGCRVTLLDETAGAVLMTWPSEPAAPPRSDR
ncbi:hypothetical protein ACIGMX_34710 [Streptomyces aquilus]|uniref:hypothetical protein n=1 Tax=Streptomyces aquilus TaxID=2548456 RepID=UPI0037CDB172